MCVPTVNCAQQNHGTATEKVAFECDKSFRVATTNLHLQNPSMTSGIMFVTIPYCIIYYLLHQEFLVVCAYPYSIAGFLIVPAISYFNCS